MVFNIWVRFCNQLIVLHQLLRSLWCRLLHPHFSTSGSICTKSNIILYILYLRVKYFFIYMRFCRCDGQCIFIICQFRYQLYFCFCFFVLSDWMLQLIIEYKLIGLQQEAGVGLIAAIMLFNIVVLHCASLPIKKKHYGHSQLCPFVSFAGKSPGHSQFIPN